MRIIVLSIVLVLFPVLTMAQGKGSFTVEFGYARHMFNMTEFNQFLKTPDSYNYNFYSTNPNYEFTGGNGYDLSVKYQPLKAIDFGVYGGVQLQKIENPINFEVIDFQTSDTLASFKGAHRLSVLGFNCGIVSNIRLNDLFNFSDKKGFIKSFLLGFEIRLGAGFGQVKDVSYFDSPPSLNELYTYNHSAWGNHGQIALKTGYLFSKEKFRSALNFKIGYQYFITSDVRNASGKGLTSSEIDARLNFSGLFFGASLEIGK